MATNKVFKLSVKRGNHGIHYIIAHHEAGNSTVWGEQKTERGVKTCMTKYAKRCGLTIKPSEDCFSLVAE